MTDDEYLDEAKKRALKYLPNVPDAIASLGSDLERRPAYREIARKMMPIGLFIAMTHDIDGAHRWIEGFRP